MALLGEQPTPNDNAVQGSVTFDRPPLSEVVFGVGYRPIAKLNSAEIGRYWAKIVDKFPRSDEVMPVPQPGVPFVVGTPVPRLMFRAADASRVVQIQPDWFLFNSVRVKGRAEYPRYHGVVADFETELERFQSHLDEV